MTKRQRSPTCRARFWSAGTAADASMIPAEAAGVFVRAVGSGDVCGVERAGHTCYGRLIFRSGPWGYPGRLDCVLGGKPHGVVPQKALPHRDHGPDSLTRRSGHGQSDSGRDFIRIERFDPTLLEHAVSDAIRMVYRLNLTAAVVALRLPDGSGPAQFGAHIVDGTVFDIAGRGEMSPDPIVSCKVVLLGLHVHVLRAAQEFAEANGHVFRTR